MSEQRGGAGEGLSGEDLAAVRRIYRHDGWESDWDSVMDLVQRSGSTVIPLLDHIDSQAAEISRLTQRERVLREALEGIAKLAHDTLTGNGGYMPTSSVFAAINTRAVEALLVTALSADREALARGGEVADGH